MCAELDQEGKIQSGRGLGQRQNGPALRDLSNGARPEGGARVQGQNSTSSNQDPAQRGMCYLCSRINLLPMFPVCTPIETHPKGGAPGPSTDAKRRCGALRDQFLRAVIVTMWTSSIRARSLTNSCHSVTTLRSSEPRSSSSAPATTPARGVLYTYCQRNSSGAGKRNDLVSS